MMLLQKSKFLYEVIVHGNFFLVEKFCFPIIEEVLYRLLNHRSCEQLGILGSSHKNLRTLGIVNFCRQTSYTTLQILQSSSLWYVRNSKYLQSVWIFSGAERGGIPKRGYALKRRGMTQFSITYPTTSNQMLILNLLYNLIFTLKDILIFFFRSFSPFSFGGC